MIGSTALVGAALGAVVLSGTPAGAQTTIGSAQNGFACGASVNGGGFNVVQKSSVGVSYGVPAGGGTLTSWSVQAGAVNGDTYQLEVWQPNGGDSFTLVFLSSPGEAINGDGTVHTFTLSPPVQVQANDVLGLVNTNDDGDCLHLTTNSGDVADFLAGPPPALNTPTTLSPLDVCDGFSAPGCLQVDVAATFDPPTATCALTATGTNQVQATATVDGGTASAFAWTDTGGTPGTGTGNPFTFAVPGPGTYTAQVTATVGGTPVVSSPCSVTVSSEPATALVTSPEFTG